MLRQICAGNAAIKPQRRKRAAVRYLIRPALRLDDQRTFQQTRFLSRANATHQAG